MKKRIKISLIALAVLLCVMLGCAVTGIGATDTPEALWGTDADNLTSSGTFAEAVAATPAYIQLQSDVVATSRVTIDFTATLDLNGHDISAADGFTDWDLINNGSGDLTIVGKGNIGTGKYCSLRAYGKLTVPEGAEPTFAGDVVLENSASIGGGIYNKAVDISNMSGPDDRRRIFKASGRSRPLRTPSCGAGHQRADVG